jgi:hypothetical protein
LQSDESKDFVVDNVNKKTTEVPDGNLELLILLKLKILAGVYFSSDIQRHPNLFQREWSDCRNHDMEQPLSVFRVVAFLQDCIVSLFYSVR